MAKITLENLRKEYGSLTAVDGIDLTIADGSYTMILGPSAAAVLVDSLTREGAGGTGQRVDLERVAAAMDGVELPCIIAGGLQPASVGEVVTGIRPYAVDVASGVEAAQGRKDPAAVRSFVTAARGAI